MWLSAIKVIDFTTLLPGPYATLRLADLGAEIVKIEPPLGDTARHSGLKVAGTGVVFLANNRNKQSTVIDLKTEDGRAKALSLTDGADVVIEGFRPGVMQKLGLDYDTVRRRNPGIVYCSLTGYGQTGPLAKFAGHDLNYAALGGLISQLCDESGFPIQPTIQLADMLGGTVASEAILAALVKREQTGKGSYLDVAITDAVTGLLTHHALIQQAFGMEHGLEELSGKLVCYHLYKTGDGQTVSLAALEPKFWRNFCHAIGRPEWIDLQFSKATEGNPVFDQLTALFLSQTLAEWTKLGMEVDCCLQPVWNVSQVLAGHQVKARGTLMQVDSPTDGTLIQLDTHAGGFKPDKLGRELT